MFFSPSKTRMPRPEDALKGRAEAMAVASTHAVLGTSMTGPWPDAELALFGLGCFWGAERLFWTLDGVVSTQVGYAAGLTPNPTYQEVCSGRTGHNEVVRVVFDPALTSFAALLRVFWEGHDPTQGMRQGNDTGTQYRSGLYWHSEAQQRAAEATRDAYQERLTAAGHGRITTELAEAGEYYYAEGYHQQYLAKNPDGYCGIGGTGVACPTGVVGLGG